MEKVIEVKNLVKKYENITAVSDVSFDIYRGEIFGLLGENGAGKTTTLEIMEGLRKATSGKITILNHNIKNGLNEIKERIGVQLQSSAYFSFLTLQEILEIFGSFYAKSLNPDELLQMVGLQEKANFFVNKLSGGQKQRFSIVASLINDPDIVFLDEPTTGLDPLARRSLWDVITKIKGKGKTVILTSHYMEEAEVLCDRIAIMDRGKVIALDKTHKLIERSSNPYRISFVSPGLEDKDKISLEKLGILEKLADKEYYYVFKSKTADHLNKALGIIHGKSPESLMVGRATLEDVFIELTGRKIEEI